MICPNCNSKMQQVSNNVECYYLCESCGYNDLEEDDL